MMSLSVGDNQRPLLPMRMQRITAPHVTPALSSFNAMHDTVTLTIFSAAGWRRAKAWLVNLLHHVHLPPQRPQARFCRTGIAVSHPKMTVQQRCVWMCSCSPPPLMMMMMYSLKAIDTLCTSSHSLMISAAWRQDMQRLMCVPSALRNISIPPSLTEQGHTQHFSLNTTYTSPDSSTCPLGTQEHLLPPPKESCAKPTGRRKSGFDRNRPCKLARSRRCSHR